MKNYQLMILAAIIWTSGIVGGRTWRQVTTDRWWEKHIEEVAFNCTKQQAGPAEHDPVVERHTQEQADIRSFLGYKDYKLRDGPLLGSIMLTGDKQHGFEWKVYDGRRWVHIDVGNEMSPTAELLQCSGQLTTEFHYDPDSGAHWTTCEEVITIK